MSNMSFMLKRLNNSKGFSAMNPPTTPPPKHGGIKKKSKGRK